MYACRIDIKYDNDEDFANGEKFVILEVNGVMGYDLDFYSKDCLLKKIIIIKRWIIFRLIIGLLNIILLNGVNIYNVFFKINERLKILYKCENWEKILEYVYT